MSTVTSARAFVTHADGRRLDLSDHLLELSVSDGLDASPSGSVALPLRRQGEPRTPWTELIAVGDHLTLELLAWDGQRGDWTTVLNGPITTLAQSESKADGVYQAHVSLTAAGMDHLLTRDSIAWWMFYATIDGYAQVRSRLSVDQLTQAPHRVAFDYLKQVAMHFSVYQHAGDLSKHLQLDFSGLSSSLSNALLSLTAPEGNHLSAIRTFLDAPLHELYATTRPASQLTGELKHAGTGPGADGGLTTLTWRVAPYPHATPELAGDVSAWQALPLHSVEGTLTPVTGGDVSLSDGGVRNFFLAYPAYQTLNERFAYAYGAGIVNEPAVARFGYAPLKTKTHLINDHAHSQESIEQEMHRLTARLAGQWNRMDTMLSGQLQAVMDPSVRPGERVRARVPWGEDRLYEFHVRGRSLTWSRSQGGRMTLALERGLPVEVYADPSYFAAGLKKIRVGGELYAQEFRRHDEPGPYWAAPSE